LNRIFALWPQLLPQTTLDDEPHVFEASSSGFLSSGHPLTVTVTFDLDPYDPDFLNN